MLESDVTPYQESLGNGLTLRTPADREDVERVAELNAEVHGAEVGPLTRRLLYEHPYVKAEDFVFVENQEGQVVSSICLFPWTWRYEDVDLPAGEMGIVGTLKPYRRRGLVRAQVAYFNRRLKERGCLLSHIQGIPFYYGQFGYHFSLPLEGGWRLELHQVPDRSVQPFSFRLATAGDIPQLQTFYEQATRDLTVRAVRDPSIWRYMLDTTKDKALAHETWLVQREDGQEVGYMRLPAYHFGEALVVDEVSVLKFEPAFAALRHLKKLAKTRGKPSIRLNLPANASLVQLARALDAHDLGRYAWQIRIPDVAALLRHLRPVLERRLAGSLFADLSYDFCISFYREAVTLRFAAGKLAEVIPQSLPQESEARIPVSQFTPLVLGHRSLEELQAAHHNVRVEGVWRLLLDTLFPKTGSFIHTVY
jgi:predicted acetyltransferase